MTDSSELDNITVVLLEPQGPRNVGSTARALKNFGLRRLRIVGPVDLSHDECREMGVRSHDILEAAELFETLDEALADQQLILGTTARRRHRQETATPKTLASEILEIAAGGGQVAILFGREDFGLPKEALRRCHHVMSIPTSAGRTSINLAQAVLLTAYEIFQATNSSKITASSDAGKIIDGTARRQLEDALLACYRAAGYLHEGNRVAIEQSVLRFLSLGPFQTRDARHLFGLSRSVQRLAERLEGDSP